jgi:hypothetical protein
MSLCCGSKIRSYIKVFENTVLTCGPKREIADCRKRNNAKLHKLSSSPNIIMVIKSRRLRWAEHMARMER